MYEKIDGSKILVIYSCVNTPGFSDATGAFIPEAKRLCKIHGVPAENQLPLDCVGRATNKRREGVLTFLQNHSGIRWIAYFGHGWSTGIQAGISINHLPLLADAMGDTCDSNLRITLYACSTASESKLSRSIKAPGTDNGFADKLRDNLLARRFTGGWVDAHLTPGHSTLNPFLLRFYMAPRFENDIDLPGGGWLVSPQSTFWAYWRKALGDAKGQLRFEFPLMTEAQIYAEMIRLGAR